MAFRDISLNVHTLSATPSHINLIVTLNVPFSLLQVTPALNLNGILIPNPLFEDITVEFSN